MPRSPEQRLRSGDGRDLARLSAINLFATCFDPVELLERLAVITPRPRINLILYHGVLAPRAAWRSQVVGPARSPDVSGPASMEAATPEGDQLITGPRRPGALRWAEVMRRTLDQPNNYSRRR